MQTDNARLYNSIGVVVNRSKDAGYVCVSKVVTLLEHYGFVAYVASDVHEAIAVGSPVKEEEIHSRSDFLICLGGDGTFLKTARRTFTEEKPVLGINLGSLGFLAEVEVDQIEFAIESLAKGLVLVSPRMVLMAEVLRGERSIYTAYAINDAVVARVSVSRIVELHVSVDGQFVDTFPSDGLIVATPTGSTAYTLSAGGPIVQPEVPLMVITPICPHILYSRSFIVAESSCLSIRVGDGRHANSMLSVDGMDGFALELGDIVRIVKAPFRIQFASVEKVNFYEVLRSKIHGRNGRC